VGLRPAFCEKGLLSQNREKDSLKLETYLNPCILHHPDALFWNLSEKAGLFQ
jgi:hypothetical protein